MLSELDLAFIAERYHLNQQAEAVMDNRLPAPNRNDPLDYNP
jgi:hypothetical protein